jgi:2-polyprenyl-3-methyl-5-hydroxy-6-metoxy-1,4-benzoquinol methylase
VLYEGLIDRLYGALGTWRLQRCVECGSAYLDPRPTRSSIGAAYADYYTHEATPDDRPNGGFRKHLRNGYLNARYLYDLEPAAHLGRFVVPLLPGRRAAADRHVRGLRRPSPGARVLDVGCGSGEFLLEMKAAGWTAEGVETDARAVARARERSLAVHEGTLESADYVPRSFDAVTLSHVIEHLHDPVATLRRCRELVSDDGVVWIATPNLAGPGYRRYGRAWRGLEPPRHLVVFTPAALARALERAGLRLVEFQRPASAGWVFSESELIAGRERSRLTARLAVFRADLGAALDPKSGDELVAVARPA